VHLVGLIYDIFKIIVVCTEDISRLFKFKFTVNYYTNRKHWLYRLTAVTKSIPSAYICCFSITHFLHGAESFLGR